MSKTGRPRKPTRVKEIQGTARKDRVNPREPRPVDPLGPCPSGLTKFGQAKWDALRAAHSWLTLPDREVAELYCRTWEQYDLACRKLRAGGLVNSTPNGFTQMSGYLQAKKALQKELLDLIREMGLTPVSRSEVHEHSPAAEENEFGKLRVSG